jgi:hypothetical protein
MIHLIGVEHRVQWKKPNLPVSQARQANWARYLSVLEKSICEIRPSAVAEEMNQEILDGHNKAESILLSMKENHEARTGMKIEHIFAEPDSAWKTAKGYKEREVIKEILKKRIQTDPTNEEVLAHVVAHQHPIRERFWLASIGKYLDGEIIFVCGSAHLCTFRLLLDEQRIDSTIVRRGIGIDSSCLDELAGLRFALENDMFSDTSCFCLGPISPGVPGPASKAQETETPSLPMSF